jgi:hypothetical protein
MNMWLGRAGLTTHMHFDATWNFFVQVGRDRPSLGVCGLVAVSVSLPLASQP